MTFSSARHQYLKTQVETASREQLVVMLFDGIIRFTEQARKAIEAKQIEESHHALMRAQAIVMELICTVDKEKGGEIASNLIALHAYAFNCLIVCNMKKDVGKIDEVQKIYRELREGWVSAMESLGIGATAAASASPAPVSQPTAKTPVAGIAPKVPASAGAASPRPVASTGAPSAISGGSGAGTYAAAKGAAPSALQGAAAGAPTPVVGYGMGKTAMLGGVPRPMASSSGALSASPGASAAPAHPKPVLAAAGIHPQQVAVRNAYQAGARSHTA